MKKLVVGITIGDPAGIGPEIVVKALSKSEIFSFCTPVVIGDQRFLRNVVNQLKLNTKLKAVESPRKASSKAGIIEVLDVHNIALNAFRVGEASREAGRASIEYIEVAVKYALKGEIDALVTAPINKKSIHLTGSSHIGHTELISSLTKTAQPITMFWVKGLAIFFLTRHLPLKNAIEAVKKEKIITVMTKADKFLRKIGFENPRIAVAALNPHASDGGLIGDEEEKEIIPAIRELKVRAINTIGPIAADSIFHQAFSGEFDAVLSLYHDQGHIPAKTVDFYGTVSVTLGLPFLRTSVDHGTAFDIAGKGVASSKSLEEAIRSAARFTQKLKAE